MLSLLRSWSCSDLSSLHLNYLMTGISLLLLIISQLHFHRFGGIAALNIAIHFAHFNCFFSLFLFDLHFWLRLEILKFSSPCLSELMLNSAIFPGRNVLCLVYQIFHHNLILRNRCFHLLNLRGEFQGLPLLHSDFHCIFLTSPSNLQMFLRQKVFQV